MNQKNSSRLAGGVLLIFMGIALFLVRLLPVENFISRTFTGWPMILIAAGFALLVFGLLVGSPDLAVPASIVAGLGGIFLYQNRTNDWGSWSYLWALIPGFVGIGIILSGLLKWRLRDELREGVRLILISAVLFTIFGSIFGGIRVLGVYWPVLLVLLGVWIIIQNFRRK